MIPKRLKQMTYEEVVPAILLDSSKPMASIYSS